MVLPADKLIVAAVLLILNAFFRARVPDYEEVDELPEELPEGFPWIEVVKELGMEGARARWSLRQRFLNRLAPGLVSGNWQPEEDAVIYREKALGRGWAAISVLLKGRSAKSVWKR